MATQVGQCSLCRAANSYRALNCIDCGAKLPWADAVQGAAPPPEPKKDSVPIGVWIVVSVLGVPFGIAIMVIMLLTTMGKPVKNTFHAPALSPNDQAPMPRIASARALTPEPAPVNPSNEAPISNDGPVSDEAPVFGNGPVFVEEQPENAPAQYLPLSGNAWSGVDVYNGAGERKSFCFEIMGGNDNYRDPMFGDTFRGMKVRMPNGVETWKDADAMVNTRYLFVRSDDPALQDPIWIVWDE